jgi:NTP pyrophosphatase (non-canonical NTP hydrolase)
MNEKLLKNINHYGVNHQQRKLQEEVFELQEAITRYEFAKKDNKAELEFSGEEKWDLEHFKKHIIEELADVQMMINQFKLYYEILDKAVTNVMIYKTDRQMERIENEDNRFIK